jgi:hypothetical protein
MKPERERQLAIRNAPNPSDLEETDAEENILPGDMDNLDNLDEAIFHGSEAGVMNDQPSAGVSSLWVAQAARALGNKPEQLGVSVVLACLSATFKIPRLALESITGMSSALLSHNNSSAKSGNDARVKLSYRAISHSVRYPGRKAVIRETHCSKGCSVILDGDRHCHVCQGTATVTYFRVPISKQLETILARTGPLSSDVIRNSNCPAGQEFLDFAARKVTDRNKTAVLLHTCIDGVEVLNRSFWFIIGFIMNLPPHTRHRDENM